MFAITDLTAENSSGKLENLRFYSIKQSNPIEEFDPRIRGTDKNRGFEEEKSRAAVELREREDLRGSVLFRECEYISVIRVALAVTAHLQPCEMRFRNLKDGG